MSRGYTTALRRSTLLLLLLLVACKKIAYETVLTGPILIGTNPVVISPTAPLKAPGPEILICAVVPGKYAVALPPAPARRILAPDSALISPRIIVTLADGSREEVPALGFGPDFGPENDGGIRACFGQHPPVDTTRRILRIELSADRELIVDRVVYWSGQRPPPIMP
jgi:hypothetical protein